MVFARWTKAGAAVLLVFALPVIIGVVWQHVFVVILSNGHDGDSNDASSALLGTGQMFDHIAARYDFINRVLALRMDVGWRRTMSGRVRDLLLSGDDNDGNGGTRRARRAGTIRWKVLDVATGTADVAIQLAKDVPPSTRIVGLDPSRKMLDVGERKIKALHLEDQIQLRQADVRDLSPIYDAYCLDDENDENERQLCFDAVTMAFGIRNVDAADRKTALCELHRLLLPKKNPTTTTGYGGGVLSIMEFSEPTIQEFGIMGWGASIFIRYVVPFVGGVLSGAPKEYWHLQNSIQDFPSPQQFQELLQTLECPVVMTREDGTTNNVGDKYPRMSVSPTLVGYFDMEEIRHMNFGSVQLYVGKAAVKMKVPPPPSTTTAADPKLPPIGRVG